MPYDIVDAYEDINQLNNKLNGLIEYLKHEGIIKEEVKKDERQK